jgi:hypothetical protein
MLKEGLTANHLKGEAHQQQATQATESGQAPSPEELLGPEFARTS